MRSMKRGKAVGKDGVAIEMLRTLDSFSTIKISIASKIYKSGDVSDDMCKSIFLIIPKKA